METEHDRIEELLAGYALDSLSGEDAREADRLLAEHVPTCPSCRTALAEYRAVAGDLALAAEPVAPPEMLLPRLRRELGSTPRRRPVTVVAAASIVAVVGMAGLAVTQGIRAANADRQSTLMGEALRLASRPGATTVSMIGPGAAGQSMTPVTEITAPGVEVVYLVCEDVAPPSPDMVYRVWVGSGDAFRYVSDLEPRSGSEPTVVELRFDPANVDQIVITEEPADVEPTQPDAAAIRWSDAA